MTKSMAPSSTPQSSDTQSAILTVTSDGRHAVIGLTDANRLALAHVLSQIVAGLLSAETEGEGA